VSEANLPINAANVAAELATRLDERGQQYVLGGAIALGYWGVPRGTVDVDLTICLPPEQPGECLRVLSEIGCGFLVEKAAASLRQHGFCRVTFSEVEVDVFLPTIPFYEVALQRCKHVELRSQQVAIWDAESLTVFKMMFFRRKDVADIEQILRTQGSRFDRSWVRQQLLGIYGAGDPRLSSWDDLVREITVN
jgi:hypothetical protein